MTNINSLIKNRQKLFSDDCSNWEIQKSNIGGKGVFARKSFKARDLIFKEIPLAAGPRTAPLPAGCVSCTKMNTPLKACGRGCRLPVCGDDCENSESHRSECELLNRLKPKEEDHWSPLLYRALTPLRCLLLKEEDKNIIRGLSANKEGKNVEFLFLKEELKGELTDDENSFFDLSCRVLKGVAYEIVENPDEASSKSLRGLYPISAMMNHSCAPNTQHYFELENGKYVMYVVATTDIDEGTEITTSYCPLLWSTMARRHFLFLTKEFLCACPRCRDPTEFGTYFSAHKCECNGFLLPISPLNIKSGWRCLDCGKFMSSVEVICMETKMYKDRHFSSTHKTNYLNIQKKLDDIVKIGCNGKPYAEIPDEDLVFKKKCIEEVLHISDQLKLGEHRMKDTLSKELDDILKEMKRKSEEQSMDHHSQK